MERCEAACSLFNTTKFTKDQLCQDACDGDKPVYVTGNLCVVNCFSQASEIFLNEGSNQCRDTCAHDSYYRNTDGSLFCTSEACRALPPRASTTHSRQLPESRSQRFHEPLLHRRQFYLEKCPDDSTIAAKNCSAITSKRLPVRRGQQPVRLEVRLRKLRRHLEPPEVRVPLHLRQLLRHKRDKRKLPPVRRRVPQPAVQEVLGSGFKGMRDLLSSTFLQRHRGHRLPNLPSELRRRRPRPGLRLPRFHGKMRSRLQPLQLNQVHQRPPLPRRLRRSQARFRFRQHLCGELLLPGLRDLLERRLEPVQRHLRPLQLLQEL
ncbi:Hypothetical_protein [Hexamita inflata]|uniref:Hypothetical_protein n=1 Tax=Hexamita inflata TaxID=28002 RepID=A0AA86RNQ5_9EUKA|nr:Hypothetical protein HINF_LOCUS62857 [Hexamita inflata]